MVHVIARVDFFPTEEQDKVRRSLLNMFPNAEVTVTDDEMVARTDDLSRFKELIRNHKILDSTRAVMLQGLREGRTTFLLNKQAAFVGKVSFAEGRSPMGPVTVEMEGEDMEALIDDVAPGTVNGEIP
ncbi:MAG: hypothetical protein LUQ09_03360 [Methanomassiliicoccales archaeon]|nr:hypothetical protein [Methanomassiliicoccales archaeon]